MGVLGPDAVEAVASTLQPTLIDLLALNLTTKQAHWNVTGKGFRSVHMLLDELYEFLSEKSDEVAERLVAIGVSASGQAADVVGSTLVPPVPSGFLKDTEVVTLMTERLNVVCRNVRERAAQVAEADPVTEDMLIAIVAELEKYHWMMRASEE